VLRRNYNIRFKDEFVRHKKTLTQKEHYGELKEVVDVYVNNGKCTNEKCSELRDVVKNILKEMYNNDYGMYEPKSCPPMEGFLNVFPILGTRDKNGNEWSKLNYIIFEPKSTTLLLITYLKKYGTFEHRDFIQWVKEDKNRLFKEEFLELMFGYIRFPKVKRVYGHNLIGYIRNVFPDSKIVSNFCPSSEGDDGDLLVVSSNGNRIVFQPVTPKSTKVMKLDGKYYLRFGRRGGSPVLNRYANYIITNNGIIFKNTNVITGYRAWEFKYPPVYNEMPYDTELFKTTKLK
jgi:hypothetical protein